MTSAPKRGLSTSKKLAFSVITVLAFLILAEIGVRAWVYFLREDYERFDLATNTFVLVPGEHRAIGHTVVINSDGFVGAELRPPSPDLWRIVTLGDSNTFGGGNEVHTYPAKLERLLQAQPDRGFDYEVVNAGIEGMDSANALRRLTTRVLPLSPNVVTLYIGWNDLMKFDPLGQDTSNVLSGASRGLDELWLVKGMRKLIFLQIRPYIDPPAVGPTSRTGRFENLYPGAFVANLESMIHETRAAGARPLVMTLATAVREEMTLSDLRDAHIYFPYYASAYGVGDLLDLVAAYNRAIRSVAARLDVPLFELDRLFGNRRDYRSLFYDTMHPTDTGQELFAQGLMNALADQGLLSPASIP